MKADLKIGIWDEIKKMRCNQIHLDCDSAFETSFASQSRPLKYKNHKQKKQWNRHQWLKSVAQNPDLKINSLLWIATLSVCLEGSFSRWMEKQENKNKAVLSWATRLLLQQLTNPGDMWDWSFTHINRWEGPPVHPGWENVLWGGIDRAHGSSGEHRQVHLTLSYRWILLGIYCTCRYGIACLLSSLE